MSNFRCLFATEGKAWIWKLGKLQDKNKARRNCNGNNNVDDEEKVVESDIRRSSDSKAELLLQSTT